MINNKYKILNEVLIEWGNSDIEDNGIIKTSDVQYNLNNYFVYTLENKRGIKSAIRILSNKWENFDSYHYNPERYKVIVDGEPVKLDINGYTVKEYDPGTHYVEIQGLNEQRLTTCKYMFYECINLVSVPLFDTSRVTDMYGMFYNCRKLIEVPPFNTKNVTNTVDMFAFCSIKSVPEFDMRSLIRGAETFWECKELETVPIFKNLNLKKMRKYFKRINIDEEQPLHKLFWKCYNLDAETLKIWNPDSNGTPQF
jgi:surface protein